jgi:protein TonB
MVRRWIAIVSTVLAAVVSLNAQSPVVTPPTKTVDVPPKYTPEAARAKIQGTVQIRITILADGSVTDPVIMQSLDRVFGLDDNALAAVRQWKFKPATRNGVPIPVRVTANLVFTLRGGDTMPPGPAYEPPPDASRAPAPPAWPGAFPNGDASIGNSGEWTAYTFTVGDLSVTGQAPRTWQIKSDTGRVVGAFSPSGLDAFMVMPPKEAPAAFQLPMSTVALEEFGARAKLVDAAQGPAVAVGQVQVGDRWWEWVESARTSEDLTYLPLELRRAFSMLRITSTHVWAFVTREGSEMIGVTFYELFTNEATPAALRRSTPEFQTILSQVAITKRAPQR